MAAPIADKIILPSDTGNVGKNVRTQRRTVGADVVQEHFFIPSFGPEIPGKYFLSTAQQTVVTAAQNGVTTGFLWLQLPSTATITAAITRIAADANIAAALAAPTAPKISFTKFSFTGTASGAQAASPNSITPYKTGLTIAQVTARTAATGMTVTLIGEIGQFAIPSAQTAASQLYGQKEVISRNPQAFTRGFDLEIGPGEGLVIYQSTAGTAADTRTFGVQVEWNELDLS